jgi:hypothetical protein
MEGIHRTSSVDRPTTSCDDRLTIRRSTSNASNAMEGSNGANWPAILKVLVTEKKRAEARQGEHYVNRALFCLTAAHPLREKMIKVAEWDLFNSFILSMIALNCVFLIFDNPVCKCAKQGACTEQEKYRHILLGANCTFWPQVDLMLGVTEVIFTAIFTLECIIKIIARGFALHKHAYLRDKWNWLDFIVVLASVISVVVSYLPEAGQNTWVQFLRTLRVLRPLRTVKRIKGMRPLLDTLAKAVENLSRVLFLLGFYFVLFGMLGHELFVGVTHRRCYVDPSNSSVFTPAAYSRFISQQVPFMVASNVNIGAWNGGESLCGTDSDCNPVVVDGISHPAVCSKMKWCHDDNSGFGWCKNDWNGNPYEQGGGLMSFDNLLASFLIVYQCVTVEGWVDQLSTFLSANQDLGGALPVIYFVLLVILGAFFVLQLLLALLSESYTQAQNEEARRLEVEALNVQALLKQAKGTRAARISWKQRIRSLVAWIRGKSAKVAPGEEQCASPPHLVARTASGDSVASDGTNVQKTLIRKRQPQLARRQSYVSGGDSIFVEKLLTALSSASAFCLPIIKSPIFINGMNVAILFNAALMGMYHHSELFYEENICRRRCDLDPNLPANASQYCSGPLFNRTWDADGSGRGVRPPQRAFCFLEQDELVLPEHKHRSCSQHVTRDACESAPARNGIGCYFVEEDDFTEWAYAVRPGCKLGLYDSNSFAAIAPYVNGYGEPRSVKFALRDFCGEDTGDPRNPCKGLPHDLENALETTNTVLVFVFLIEMILGMVGLGMEDYFSDNMNTFDCVLVTYSFIELLLVWGGISMSGGLDALRGLRLLRLFKLARSWKDMRVILTALAQSLGGLFYTSILLAIFLYIFALLGMALFGGIQDLEGGVGKGLRFAKTDSPRSNFDSFFPTEYGHGAFVVVFQIITGENWNEVMYSLMTNNPQNGEPANAKDGLNALFPMTIVFFGNYVIVNVFIAILLLGFVDKGNDFGDDDEETGKSRKTNRVLQFFDKLLQKDEGKKENRFAKIGTLKSYRETRKLANALMRKCYSHASGGCTLISTEFKRAAESATRKRQSENLESEATPVLDEDLIEVSVWPGKRIRIPDHNSFLIFTPLNRFRMWCSWIVHHPIVDNFILVCIMITTITLVLVETPEDMIITDPTECPSSPDFLDCSGPDSNYPGHVGLINCPRTKNHPMFGKAFEACDSPNAQNVPDCCAKLTKVQNLLVLDQIFAIIFVLEMLLKMIADGLILHPLAYMRDGWNILDFGVVVISLLTAFSSGESSKQFKVLRAFRALRPLRAVKRNPGLKVAATCLIASLPSMLNVLLVVLVWIFMYSMLGVQLYRGGFFRCENVQDQLFYGTTFRPLSPIERPRPNLSGPDSVPSIIECVSAGQLGSGDSLVSSGIWEPRDFTFDNVLTGVLILIETSTTEGWLDLMAMCTDYMGVGLTPLPNQNSLSGSLFASLHVFLGSFVLWNLIVAEVISNYMRIKCENDGIAPNLTQEQEDWKRHVRLILALKPRYSVHGPKGKVRRQIYNLVHHEYFDLVITTAICANVIIMMFDVHNQSACTVTAFFWIDAVFTVLFLGEALLKLIGPGPRWYFVDGWNVFDFCVVIVSISTVVIETLQGQYTCSNDGIQRDKSHSFGQLGILRVFRILRVLRLVRRVKGIRDMLQCLIDSVPALASVTGLLLLLMTIFAVLGTNLFWNVNPRQNLYGNVSEESSLNVDNYRQIGGSVLMLMRFTTGEAWNAVMYFCMQVLSCLQK